MRNLSQTQFYVVAFALVVVLGLLVALAVGLQKYNQQLSTADEQTQASLKEVPPSTPDDIAEELQAEEGEATALIEDELQAENEAIEAETRELTTVTQSYE